MTVFEKYVHTMLVKDKGHLNTGMIGTQIMFDYLLENNRNDLIDIMVNQKTYPGWGYMVEKGATTCWEQWNGYLFTDTLLLPLYRWLVLPRSGRNPMGS